MSKQKGRSYNMTTFFDVLHPDFWIMIISFFFAITGILFFVLRAAEVKYLSLLLTQAVLQLSFISYICINWTALVLVPWTFLIFWNWLISKKVPFFQRSQILNESKEGAPYYFKFRNMFISREMKSLRHSWNLPQQHFTHFLAWGFHQSRETAPAGYFACLFVSLELCYSGATVQDLSVTWQLKHMTCPSIHSK